MPEDINVLEDNGVPYLVFNHPDEQDHTPQILPIFEAVFWFSALNEADQYTFARQVLTDLNTGGKSYPEIAELVKLSLNEFPGEAELKKFLHTLKTVAEGRRYAYQSPSSTSNEPRGGFPTILVDPELLENPPTAPSPREPIHIVSGVMDTEDPRRDTQIIEFAKITPKDRLLLGITEGLFEENQYMITSPRAEEKAVRRSVIEGIFWEAALDRLSIEDAERLLDRCIEKMAEVGFKLSTLAKLLNRAIEEIPADRNAFPIKNSLAADIIARVLMKTPALREEPKGETSKAIFAATQKHQFGDFDYTLAGIAGQRTAIDTSRSADEPDQTNLLEGLFREAASGTIPPAETSRLLVTLIKELVMANTPASNIQSWIDWIVEGGRISRLEGEAVIKLYNSLTDGPEIGSLIGPKTSHEIDLANNNEDRTEIIDPRIFRPSFLRIRPSVIVALLLALGGAAGYLLKDRILPKDPIELTPVIATRPAEKEEPIARRTNLEKAPEAPVTSPTPPPVTTSPEQIAIVDSPITQKVEAPAPTKTIQVTIHTKKSMASGRVVLDTAKTIGALPEGATAETKMIDDQLTLVVTTASGEIAKIDVSNPAELESIIEAPFEAEAK